MNTFYLSEHDEKNSCLWYVFFVDKRELSRLLSRVFMCIRAGSEICKGKSL
jgi:hypothetical protein